MTASKEPTKIQRGTSQNEDSDVLHFKKDKLGTDFTFKRKIVWFNAIGFLFMHLVAVYGLYLMFTKAHRYTNYWTILVMFLASEGITAGAHRLYSHKAYKATTLLKIILVTLQTMAGQNCMYIWVRDHRQHHKYSDTDADPHNATRGFFFSHIGWLMSKKHPLVIKLGKTVDMSDLENDRIVMFQKKYYKPLYILLAMFIPISVPVYFWNEDVWTSVYVAYFTRYIIQLNATWLVNSWAHLYGTRPYNKKILPVETYFVGIVAIGEGWHNYHHTFPWDYKASEIGAPMNITRLVIELFAKLGLAYDLRSATDSMIERRHRRTGDGTIPAYGLMKQKYDTMKITKQEKEQETDDRKKNENEHESLEEMLTKYDLKKIVSNKNGMQRKIPAQG